MRFLISTLALFALSCAAFADEPASGSARSWEMIDKARLYLKSEQKVERARGPAGELTRIGGKVSPICSTSHTVGEVADKGVRIPVQGRIGIGDAADVTAYDYVLFLLVTDPKGNKVTEFGNHRVEKNGTANPEIGGIAFYRACPEIGKYEVEVSLLVINPSSGSVSLVDRDKCTFEVTAARESEKDKPQVQDRTGWRKVLGYSAEWSLRKPAHAHLWIAWIDEATGQRGHSGQFLTREEFETFVVVLKNTRTTVYFNVDSAELIFGRQTNDPEPR